MLSDLDLRFNTPTINLLFQDEDFLVFVRHLAEYLSLDLREELFHDRSYPVGVLTGSAGDVRVYFVHYHSFEQARSKWVERSRRVDFANLYVVMEAQPGTPMSVIEAFDRLDVPNKVILTDGPQPGIASHFPMSLYDSSYIPGKIVLYKTRFSPKRYLDEFDSVAFLNSGLVPADNRQDSL